MKDVGEANNVLGIKIERDRNNGKDHLTQKGYLQKVLYKFNINGDMKSVSILLAPYFKLRATISPTIVVKREYISHIPYVNAVGSLMHAMVCMRSDLSQVVSMVSRYMHDPDRGHWRQ